MRWIGLGLMLGAAACGGESDIYVGRALSPLAEAGPWNIPVETLAIAALVRATANRGGSRGFFWRLRLNSPAAAEKAYPA